MSSQAVLACVIVVAALVIRTAVLEKAKPGTARREWSFLSNRTALVVGGVVFLAMSTAVAASGYGWGNLAWALLAGLLAAFIADQVASRKR